MPLKRRDFLKIAGAASLSFPLFNCTLDKLSPSDSENRWLPGIEKWVPAVCQACPGGCGIMVRKIDDRAVKVEGNPLHPLNKGRICPQGQAGLQLLYSPLRIKTPLKKVGGRSKGKWESIGWDEAINIIIAKLQTLRESGKSHTVAFVGRNDFDASSDLIASFLKVYGSPNHVRHDKWMSVKNAYYRTQGVYNLLAPDLEKSEYILSFGSHFLSNWPNVMENQRIYGEKRANRDGKIVHIEPRFSIEGSRADLWIPINPGTEGLLALGIASVIIKEDLYNKTYIKKFASNFEDWISAKGERHPGFKSAVTKNIRLDQVSDRTGVPLRAIIEIAKEFSSRRPSIALVDSHFSFQSNDLFNILAVHSLNALVGSIDTPGGMLRQRRAPLKDMPRAVIDDVAQKGLSKPRMDAKTEERETHVNGGLNEFIDNVLARSPYEVNCLFLVDDTPYYSLPFFRKVEEAYRSIPFVVRVSCFMDETADFADLILPDTTCFEKWREKQISSLSKTAVLGVSQPVVSPLYQSRPFEDVILSLANKMGNSFAQNFPWTNYKELLFYRLRGLFEARRGSVFAPSYEEAQLKILEERGWWVSRYANKGAFMKDLLERGGWHDPVYHFNERSYVYENADRKYEFFSPSESEYHLLGEQERKKDYAYLLYFYDLPFASDENASKLPWLQENLGFRFNLKWKTWVEINPETADELDIQDNELVSVKSPYGEIKAVAKLFPGIMPGVLGLPLGKEEDFTIEAEKKRPNNPLSLIGKFFEEKAEMDLRPNLRANIIKLKRS